MAKKGAITPIVRINPGDMARLKKAMNQLKKVDKGGLSSELGAWASHTARDASARAPKKTSKLSQSYFYERSGNTALVANKKLYAPFVEFGTGAFVDTSELSKLGIPESYAMQFKGQGKKQINLPARPHLFPSASHHFNILFQNLQKRIIKAWGK